MPIYTGINDNLILPLAHFCVDDGFQPTERPCCPALIMAPMLPGAIADPDQPYAIATCAQAEELFGTGSVAADMACYYLFNNAFGELFVVGLEDTGAQAEACIEITNAPTNAGTLTIRIGDTPYYITVFPSDTTQDIADTLFDAINSDSSAPFIATSSANSKVTIQAKNGGEQGNTIPICVNTEFGEEDPEGIKYEITPFENGAGFYDLDTALANLGECCYDFTGIPFCDVANFNQLEEEMIDRWSCDRLIGGRWYATCCDTFTNHINLLNNVEYQYGSIILCCPEECHIPWRETAAFIGRTHLVTCIDPSRSWYGQQLEGIRCATSECEEDCFTRQERNILALNGGTVTRCGPNGFKIIELESAVRNNGLDDIWRYPQTAYQTIRFLRSLNNFVNSNFANTRIVDDLSSVVDGTSAITPEMMVELIKAWAIDTQSGLIDNANDLNDFIQIDRNPNNPNRIDMCINIDLANALRVIAIKVRPSLRGSFGFQTNSVSSTAASTTASTTP